MTREEAIAEIHAIQNGSGIRRDLFPEKWIASIPKANWGEGLFSLGMEYGYILGLLEAFQLTVGDVENG